MAEFGAADGVGNVVRRGGGGGGGYETRFGRGGGGGGGGMVRPCERVLPQFTKSELLS